MPYFLLFINIILMLAGQTMWKLGLSKVGGLHLKQLFHVLVSPWILGGTLLYALATIIWLAVLSRLPFSVAYPFQSIAYAVGLLIAWLVFGEIVTLRQWVGAGVIVIGVLLMSLHKA
ncbi:MAG: EamA family transporter [Candidatus Cohnella colombiensis]|uniref:EamA family transporter n=1 Tax=Candidatus Cohnella colombiensis TaxID=3121368 RepID=A0AA95EW65_9BACL|nr:MAG: EamA family transporter [Cohnella sp.]